MIRLFVDGIGLIGPGLDSWSAAWDVLLGTHPYQPAPVRPPPIGLLPPTERRRAGTAVRLAITAGTEALAQAGYDATDMAMVFAASGGDGETIHEILAVLATHPNEMSPTRFHNSVHNAPSGYWALATGSRAPSTSLSAFDDSFSAGLLEAGAQAVVEGRPVTLVAYDVPYPEPLHAARPILSMFGVSMVLTPFRSGHALAELTITTTGDAAPGTPLADPGLEQLRLGNPAARSLPLLAAIGQGRTDTIRLEGGLDVAVIPP